jgi:VCBS repeat-containing protein
MRSYETTTSRRGAYALLAVAACAFLVGCGTIIHGGSQDVSVASEPSGATVEIDGTEVGDTPLTKSLDRGSQHTIEISMDGYEEEQIIVDKNVSGWVAGNIVFGGLVGLVVDAATGGMYKLSPTQVRQTLDNRTAMNEGDGEDTVFIAVVMEPDSDWEKIGQLEPVQ